MSEVSTKPYLIRAIHEWCVDSGYTPYVAVAVNEQCQVPLEFVRSGEIVLNTSPLATNKLQLGNEWIEFQARFGGMARDIMVPIGQVSAIYARENGQGMAFEVLKPLAGVKNEAGDKGLAGNQRTRAASKAPVLSDAAESVDPTKEKGGFGKGLKSVKPVTEQSEPSGAGINKKTDENPPKKPPEKKKSHLTRIK